MILTALLKLSRPIELSSPKIQPIQLPSDCGESIAQLELSTVVGTGFTKLNGTDHLLRETKVIILPSGKDARSNKIDKRSIIYTISQWIGTPYLGDSGDFKIDWDHF